MTKFRTATAVLTSVAALLACDEQSKEATDASGSQVNGSSLTSGRLRS
jgi:hypothetical protein